MENRNVFLFGAGTSFDAGIPLLNNFVDCMLEIALRGKCVDKKLDKNDIEVFDAAVKVRESLDGYHGRAAFDDRNIEDLLSILSLSANGGSRSDKARFNSFVRAIARTIDLRCSIPPSKLDHARQDAGAGVYANFWQSLIEHSVDGRVPVIVSLNYDLVLERSLIATLAGDNWSPRKKPLKFDCLHLRYHCETLEEQFFGIEQARFHGEDFRNDYYGYSLKPIHAKLDKCLTIEILKLHGSLNFPRKKSEGQINVQHVQENPLIMPPVFVKSGERNLEPVWARAMEVLRNAINLTVCGYSLPVSDTYMQYFLKAALGPNKDLSKILVFDPVLDNNSQAAQAMRSRYSEVFSQQIRNRIYFDPVPNGVGTFSGFVDSLRNNPRGILFLPT